MRIFKLSRNEHVEIPKSNMQVKGAPRNWTRYPRRRKVCLLLRNSANAPKPATANPRIKKNEHTTLLIQPNSLLPSRYFKPGLAYHINFATSTSMIEVVKEIRIVRRPYEIEFAPTKY